MSAEPAEDVLEETPDFLRDTPEQERLWFEQRPPGTSTSTSSAAPARELAVGSKRCPDSTLTGP